MVLYLALQTSILLVKRSINVQQINNKVEPEQGVGRVEAACTQGPM